MRHEVICCQMVKLLIDWKDSGPHMLGIRIPEARGLVPELKTSWKSSSNLKIEMGRRGSLTLQIISLYLGQLWRKCSLG